MRALATRIADELLAESPSHDVSCTVAPGLVWPESEVDQGASFFFTLPAASAGG